MARPPRDIAPGDHSHTTFRTHNREFLFLTPKDHAFLYRALVRMKERFKVKIFALVSMSNHYHFLHEAPVEWHEETPFAQSQKEEGNPIHIGDMLREILSHYVNCFNRANAREGSIVKDRTRTVRQQTEYQEITTVCYQFANPVRAGIVKHPKDYYFHNYHLYAWGKCVGPLKKFQSLFDFPDWYKELGKTWKERQRRFRNLMDKYLSKHGLLKCFGASRSNGPGRDKKSSALREFLEFSYSWLLNVGFYGSLRGPPE